MGFAGEPEVTGRPSYHPSVLLKLYIYGYLNPVQSSRWLEREAGRNVEAMWLLGRLVPDHKTVADVRKDNGPAKVRALCRAVSREGSACQSERCHRWQQVQGGKQPTGASRARRWSGAGFGLRRASRAI
jgi:hypothetical protein